jgi:hypothetical protein
MVNRAGSSYGVLFPMTYTEGAFMADASQVAEGFFNAWTGKDFEPARSLLHDDVSFEGPIDTFTDADSYIASLRQLSSVQS